MQVYDTPAAIDAYRDRVMLMHVKARSMGRHLTRPSAAPTLAQIRREYGITARSWATAYPELLEAVTRKAESYALVTNA